MNNFSNRVITGISLVFLTITAVRIGPFSFAVLLLLLNFLGLREFYRLFEVPVAKTTRRAAYFLSASLFITSFAFCMGLIQWKWLLINLPVAFFPFLTALYASNPKPVLSLPVNLLGVMYITLPVCLFLGLPFLQHSGRYNYEFPLGMFFLLWTNDTVAFVTGRLFGKHKLFERISPKKTWEGTLGGGVAVLGTARVNFMYLPVLDQWQWTMLALLTVIGGTYGDLVKSMFKRSANVKDSGTILPGHGGILDRFDSLLGSAPFAFAYLTIILI